MLAGWWWVPSEVLIWGAHSWSVRVGGHAVGLRHGHFTTEALSLSPDHSPCKTDGCGGWPGGSSSGSAVVCWLWCYHSQTEIVCRSPPITARPTPRATTAATTTMVHQQHQQQQSGATLHTVCPQPPPPLQCIKSENMSKLGSADNVWYCRSLLPDAVSVLCHAVRHDRSESS